MVGDQAPAGGGRQMRATEPASCSSGARSTCAADVHGWADGMLVSLAVRDGRLCGWRQRSCSEAAAGTLLAETPAAWVPFALRNAELAARLAGPAGARG